MVVQKVFQRLKKFLQKMKISTDSWKVSDISQFQSIILNKIELKKRLASPTFVWVNEKCCDETCLHIGDFNAKYRYMNDQYLVNDSVSIPIMNVSIKIFNKEFSNESSKIICLETKILPNKILDGNIVGAWVNRKSRKALAKYFKQLCGSQTNIVEKYEKILIPWIYDNHHLLFVVDCGRKLGYILNPNINLHESEIVRTRLVKDLKLMILILHTFGWSGDLELETTFTKLKSFQIYQSNPGSKFFPCCNNQGQSSTLVLMNMYYIQAVQKEEETVNFVSVNCLAYFKQFLFSLLSEYHSCQSIEEKVLDHDYLQSAGVLNDTGFFKQLNIVQNSKNLKVVSLVHVRKSKDVGSHDTAVSSLSEDIPSRKNSKLLQSKRKVHDMSSTDDSTTENSAGVKKDVKKFDSESLLRDSNVDPPKKNESVDDSKKKVSDDSKETSTPAGDSEKKDSADDSKETSTPAGDHPMKNDSSKMDLLKKNDNADDSKRPEVLPNEKVDDKSDTTITENSSKDVESEKIIADELVDGETGEETFTKRQRLKKHPSLGRKAAKEKEISLSKQKFSYVARNDDNEYSELCEYLEDESPEILNNQIKELTENIYYFKAAHKPRYPPKKDRKEGDKYHDVVEDEIPEEEKKFYHQQQVSHTFSILEKKLRCDYIMYKKKGYLNNNEEEYLLCQGGKVNIKLNERYLYGNEKFYFLEADAVKEFLADSKPGRGLHKFVRMLHNNDNGTDNDRKKWTRIKDCNLFHRKLKAYLCEAKQANARWFQDYHFIRYKENEQLWGYCYFNNKVTWAEELNEAYICGVEHYKKEYKQARNNPGRLVPLRIGRGGTSSSRQQINKDFENNPCIQYPQGKQQKCLEYSLKSALYFFKQHKVESNEKKNIDDIISEIDKWTDVKEMEKSSSINMFHVRANNIIGTLKEKVFDVFNWEFKRLDNKKKYLQTNFDELKKMVNQNRRSMFLAQICDNAADNNHWVTFADNFIFDTRILHAKVLTKENLHSCAPEKYYKHIGYFYQITKKGKKKSRRKRKKSNDEVIDVGVKKVRFKENFESEHEKRSNQLFYSSHILKDILKTFSLIHTKLNDGERQRVLKYRDEVVKIRGSQLISLPPPCNFQIQKENFLKLVNGGWLYDDVVNSYQKLLQKRDDMLVRRNMLKRKNFLVNSFALLKYDQLVQTNNIEQLGSWFKDVDLFSCDKMLFPFNQTHTHWFLIVAYMSKREIKVFDSMGGRYPDEVEKVHLFMKAVHKIQKNYDMLDEWKIYDLSIKVPSQKNCNDCGVFMLMFADLILLNEKLLFSQEDANEYRLRIALSLIQNNAAI